MLFNLTNVMSNLSFVGRTLDRDVSRRGTYVRSSWSKHAVNKANNINAQVHLHDAIPLKVCEQRSLLGSRLSTMARL